MYPTNQNITPAIEYKPIFFAQIADTLLDVTNPDSSIANPSAIHITRKPLIKNRSVFKAYAVSSSTAAKALAANSDENNTNDSEQDNQNQNENDDNQSDSSKNNENEQENNKQENKDNKDDKEQGDKNSSDNKNKQDDLQQDKQSATAILDALKNNEKINKKMQISQSKRKKLEKDW